MFESPIIQAVPAAAAPSSSPERQRRRVLVGWGDTDFNGHLRNVAYLDKAADTRLLFFARHGFPAEVFAARRFGPVMRRDEVEYFREVRLLEGIEVDLCAVALSPDGARFVIRNEFHREDGELAARVTSSGGWLDLDRRRLTAPPPTLAAALHALPRAPGFSVLEPLRVPAETPA